MAGRPCQPCGMRGIAVSLLLMPLALEGSASAQTGCGRFDWPVDREVALFSDGFMASVEASSWLPKEGAFTLLLEPVASTQYLVAPERGRDDGFGGIVTLQWIAAGRYQLTLSDDAWVDAIQKGRRLAPLASTGRTDCPGIRQSIQFEVQSLPLTLQFGGARVRRLNISVLRAH